LGNLRRIDFWRKTTLAMTDTQEYDPERAPRVREGGQDDVSATPLTKREAYDPELSRGDVVPDFTRIVPAGIDLPGDVADYGLGRVDADNGDRLGDDGDDVGRRIEQLGVAGYLITLASVLLLLVDLPTGMVGMFVGGALFSLANYAAYRIGRPAWLGPALAAKLVLACSALAATAATAGIAA
jgi:hypothetical protein